MLNETDMWTIGWVMIEIGLLYTAQNYWFLAPHERDEYLDDEDDDFPSGGHTNEV